MSQKRYERCGSEVADLCSELIQKYHPQLKSCDLTVDLVFAYPPEDEDGNITAPALTHGGYPANGIAKIISVKERELGRADCEISLDGHKWAEFNEEERAALLDHELEHFEVAIDPKTMRFKYDTAMRPKLKMKKHDYQFGWFTSIARRRGKASPEVTQATQMMEENGQLFWPEIMQQAA